MSASTVKGVRQALIELIGAPAVSLGEGLGRLVVTTSKELAVPGYPQVAPGALASLANAPEFRQIVAEQRLARRRAIAAIGDVGECAIVRQCGRDGVAADRWKMILPDASEPGNWRTQTFDMRGFYGHVSFATRELAIADAANSGFSLRDDTALDRIQDTPAFQRGLFVTDLVGQVNAGKITHAEGDRRLAEYDDAARVLHSVAQTGAQAFIAAGGETIYLLADRIEKGAEQGVYLHEIVHRHGRAVLGQASWDKLNHTLSGWSQRPAGSVERLIHDRANSRAKAAAGDSASLFAEEFFAYSVEEAVTLGVKPNAMAHPESAEQWLDAVTKTLTEVVSKVMGGQAGALDAQQVVDLAYALAQLESPQRMAQIRDRLDTKARDSLSAYLARAGWVSPDARAPGELFYSELAVQVGQSTMQQAPASAWQVYINALRRKGVKNDEIEWSGVIEWLALQQGKVAKSDLMQFIRHNGVQVQETVIGDGTGWSVVDQDTGGARFIERFDTESEAQTRAQELDEDAYGVIPNSRAPESSTQYAEYALPGGENYREVLLTLPLVEVNRGDELNRLRARHTAMVELATEFAEAGDVEKAASFTAKAQALQKNIAQALAQPVQKRTENYQTRHWEGQNNVIAHIRLNDRLLPSYSRAQIADIEKRILALMDKPADFAANLGSGAPGMAVQRGVISRLEAAQYSHFRGFRNVDVTGAVSKVLFVEEIQSDWGQQGKKKGFGSAPSDADLKIEVDGKVVTLIRDGQAVMSTTNEQRANEALERERSKKSPGVPTAPFVTKTDAWLTLALKRVMAMGVEQGYDEVAFINGQQSVDRYNLSKQIREVSYDPSLNGGTLIADAVDAGPATQPFMDLSGIKPEEIAKHIGKDAAHRLLNFPTERDGDTVTLRDPGLRAGGLGMLAFYDEIVPNALRSVLKKFGGEGLKQIDMPAGKPTIEKAGRSFYEVASKIKASEQIGFRITPRMREMTRMGMPLFSLELTAAVAQYAQGVDPDLIEAQAQCAAVVSRTIGTDGWMKAPNGLPTLLTQSQWILVRTENFKRWFGDWEKDPQNASQAIHGETGEPMVMYHGSQKAGFSEFEPEKRQGGNTPAMFFTSDPGVARTYAGTPDEAVITQGEVDEDGYALEGEQGIYAVFLNIRRPAIHDFEGANWDGTREGQWMVVEEDEDDSPISDDDGKQYFSDKSEAQRLADSVGAQVVPAVESFDSTNSVVTMARKYGDDGALMYDVVDDGRFGGWNGASHIFAIFNARQVKSATQNEGTFHPDSPDIRYSMMALAQTPETPDPERQEAEQRAIDAGASALRVANMSDDELRLELFRRSRIRVVPKMPSAKAATLSQLQQQAGEPLTEEQLYERHTIAVADDGLVEVERVTPANSSIIGNLPIALYHHTASALLPAISEQGLVIGKPTNFFNTQAGVYVSTMAGGRPVDTYSQRAAHVHGGDPITIRVKRLLSEITPDPDDADLNWAQGRQFITPSVPVADVILDQEMVTLVGRKARASAFKAWSQDLPVVEGGRASYIGGAAVFESFHGTTHTDITAFKKTGSSEGFLGQGPYFTTSALDASANYAGVGPDLTERLAVRKENLADGLDDFGMRELLGDYYGAHDSVEPVALWDEDDAALSEAWEQHGDAAAQYAAEQSLKGASDGLIMKVFVKLANPADTTGCSGSRDDLTYEREYDDDGDIVNETGTLVDWIMTTRRVMDAYGAPAEDYIDAMLSEAQDSGGIGMDEVFALARKHLSDVYDDQGEVINAGGVFREIAEEAGFDGIIMDADLHFGSGRRGFGGVRILSMAGVDAQTLHVVPFSPNQVKSAFGNNGQYDPQNPDIRYSMPSMLLEPAPTKTDLASTRKPVSIEFGGRNSVNAFAGKKFIGQASAWEDSRGEFVILKSAVSGPYRRRGVATAMYKAIEQAAGRELKPAVSLSDDAFEFWKSYRPSAVALDLRHRKDELIGRKVKKSDRIGTIIEASGGIARVAYDDATRGSANSETCIRRDDLEAALAAAQSHQLEPQGVAANLQACLVDAEGKPLVVYHATKADFSEFSKEKTVDGGFHFGTAAQANMRVAGAGKNLMPAYLFASNMQRSKDEGGDWKAKIRAAKASGRDGIVYLNRYEDLSTEVISRLANEGLLDKLDRMSDTEFRRAVPEAQDSYIVFDPTQIKSAIGNCGDFDTSKADIRYSMPAQTVSHQGYAATFQNWFDGSAVVDGANKPMPVYRGEHGETEDGGLQTMLGSYTFTDNPQSASVYALNPNDNGHTAQSPRLVKAYLAIKNPIFVGNDDPFLELKWLRDKLGLEEALRIARKFADDIEYTGNWMEDEAGNFTGFDTVSQFLDAHPEKVDLLYFNAYRYLDDADEVAKLRALGFDGAVHVGNGETGSDMEYRVFDKAQVKPVFSDGIYAAHRQAIPLAHSNAFNRWFKRSQVSDAHGQPKVQYHSTVADFDKFKRRRNDIGMHFGTTGQAADRFDLKNENAVERDAPHATMPVYLSIQKALRMDDVGAWDRENIISQLPDEFTLKECVKAKTLTQVRDLIKSHGYDGIVYKNTGETQGGSQLRAAQARALTALWTVFPRGKCSFSPEDQKHPLYVQYSQACAAYQAFREQNAQDSWIAFEATQIKSAIGNRGTFDARKADVRYSMPAPVPVNERMRA